MEPEAYDELYRIETTHWWYVGMRRITNRLLARALNGNAHRRILDAGCGTGGNLRVLARYGTPLGIDFSARALGYASRDHAGKLAQASVEALPYPDAAFDLLACFDVLYHSGVRDDTVALAEFARVLRPGGVALIRVPALPQLRGAHDDAVHGARRYRASELRRKIEQAGLRVQRMTYANALLMPVVYLSRRLENLRPRDDNQFLSDVERSSGLADGLMSLALRAEALWIASGHNFSAGVSLIALAFKPL